MRLSILLLLLAVPAFAQIDNCYRPPLPKLCVPKDDTRGEHMRCLVADSITLRAHALRLDAYYKCHK